MAAYFNYRNEADEKAATENANRLAAADAAAQRTAETPAQPAGQVKSEPPSRTVTGSVYRDASGLHVGVTAGDAAAPDTRPRVGAPQSRVTKNRYGSWHKRPNMLGKNSDGSMGAWSPGGPKFIEEQQKKAEEARQRDERQQKPRRSAPSSAQDFRDAVRPDAPQQQEPSRIAQIDQQAEQAAKAREERRAQAERDANMSVGEAFSEVLAKWRDDASAIVRNGRERVVERDAQGNELRPGVNRYEAKYRDSQNRYRIGMLRPETVRALNQQRSALGLKTSDSIVGIFATSGVDANGKATGEPQIVTMYRSADGRIHKKVRSYQEAARFVRGTMGEKGDASADDRFASMKQWQDADGNDALGISRTSEYQARKAKLEAERLKNDETRAKTEQIQAQTEKIGEKKSRGDILRDRADALEGKNPEQAERYRAQADQADAMEELERRKKQRAENPPATEKPTDPGKAERPQGGDARNPQPAPAGNPPGGSAAPEKAPAPDAAPDYDSPAGQAQVKKDVESGGGRYSEDADGNRTIRIGNWDYLPENDRKAMGEWQREDDDNPLDIKAVHDMQKKANEAKAAFDKKRKEEEDKFRKTLEGRGYLAQKIERKVKEHMAKWDGANDPAKKRRDEAARQDAKGHGTGLFLGGGLR